MYVYIILLFITCFLTKTVTYCAEHYTVAIGNRKPRFFNDGTFGFCLVFILLAFISAIRDGIGIDYTSYLMHISNIQHGFPNYMEIGFKQLCVWLSYIDSNPRFVLVVVSILTCFFYIKAIWDQSEDITTSIFIFLSWGYYFLTFNTVRNYLALAIVLYAIKFLNKEGKKYNILFSILVVIASSIHKSALICLPMYFWAKKELKPKHVLVLLGIVATAFLLKGPVRNLVFMIYPGYLDSAYDTGRISWLNVIKEVAVILLCLGYYSKVKENKLQRFYFNLNVYGLIYYVGFYWMPEVSRVGFYMNATTIMLLPSLMRSIDGKDSKLVKIIVYVFSFILFLLLLQQFQSPTTLLLPYKTWLFDGTY